jgi:sugar-phosphatase
MLSKALQQTIAGKRLLIFDFDGTLADTTPMHAQAFAETLAPLGISVDYTRLAGRKTVDALLLCFSDTGLPKPDDKLLAKLVAEKQQRARFLIATALNPLPGVDEFLRWAKSRYKMALVTSGSRGTVELALEKLRYKDWFDLILFAEDVHLAKPNPEGFLRVLQMTGISAEEALVFEDAYAGFEAAEDAYIDCIDVRQFDWSIPEIVRP